MESIVETNAATILQFVLGLRGSLHVTLEAIEYIFLSSWEIKTEILDKRMPGRLKYPQSE